MNTSIKLFGILFTLLITSNIIAQRPGQDRKKEMEAELIGFLTQRLELSPDQAQVFFPLYREHKEQERSLRKAMRPEKRMDQLSDAESESLLNNILKTQDELHNLNKSYQDKYIDVLNARQMIALMQAEQDFKKRLLKNISQRRKRMGQKRGMDRNR